MNKSYLSILNESLGAWVAASEVTRGRGRQASATSKTLGGACALLLAMPALADVGVGNKSTYSSGSEVCATADNGAAVSNASVWTCLVPNGAGGMAMISNVPTKTGTGYPDLATLKTLYAPAQGAIAIGDANSSAGGINSLAIGAGAVASADNSVAIGTSARASTLEAVALGQNALALGAGSVAIGYQAGLGSGGAGVAQDFNVAVGAQAGQTVNGAYNTTFGAIAGNNVTGGRNLSLGNSAGDDVTGDDNVSSGTAAGAGVVGSRNFASGFFAGNTVAGNNNIALGSEAGNNVTASNTVAIGTRAQAEGEASIAIGMDATATGTRSISVGTGNAVTGNDAGAIGDPNTVSGNGSYAVGNNNTIAAANAFVLGNNVTIAAGLDGAVALGNGTTVSASNPTSSVVIAGKTYLFAGTSPAAGGTVSIGSDGSERQITHLAAGRISGTSTDAVNGSQLYATNQAVDALDAAAVKYDVPGGVVDYTRVTLGGPTSLDGGVTGGTTLTNVHQGAITAISTDAVNGSQLFQTNTNLTNLGNTVAGFAGDTTTAYTSVNGTGIRYVRTNESGLAPTDAFATGQGATAVGYNATASAAGSVAIGRGSGANILGGVALGQDSVSDRPITPGSGLVPGYAPVTFNTTGGTLLGAVSVGSAGANTYRQITNVADGTQGQDAATISQLRSLSATLSNTANMYFHANSTAGDSISSGLESIAVGPTTVVNGASGIGIGNGAVVQMTAPGGTAIGQAANVEQADGVALGTQANAVALRGVAIGAGATVSNSDSVAIGAGAMTLVGSQTGYTAYALATPQNSAGEFSVGRAGAERQVTNVAAGSADTDAVNVAQLKVVATAATNSVQYDGTAKDSVTLGGATSTDGGMTGGTTITNLHQGRVTADSTDAVNGSQLYVVQQQVTNIAAGGGIKYFHTNSTLSDSVAVGADSTAVGPRAVATGANSIAIGNAANASADGSVALGANAVASRGTETYTGAYSNTVNNTAGTVSVGSAGAERTVSNVADGYQATDAVNLRQLTGAVQQANAYTDAQVTNVVNGTAGFFQVNNSANLAHPIVTGNNALAGGAGAVASGTNSTALGNGARASANNAVAIGAGSVADRAGTVSVGTAGGERQVVNVAAGTAATDAVNVGQLQSAQAGTVQYDKNPDGSTNYSSVTLGNGKAPNGTVLSNVAPGVRGTDAVNVNQLNDTRDALYGRIDDVAKNAYAGVAASMAVQMPASFVPGKTVMRMGAGVFKGQSAVGLSFRRTAENNAFSVTGGVGASRAGAAATVGAEWVIN